MKTKDPVTAFAEIPVYPMGEVPDNLFDARLSCALAKRVLLARSYDSEVDPETAITDTLADLRHLCERLGVDYYECDARAYRLYLAEKGTE